MTRIREVLARDLDQTIEEIIKLDQVDEQSVYSELTEYVVTDRIRDQYRALFQAIAEGPSEPSEGIGVWISGFFGSGKSSFAKNLGYVLANPPVLGIPAAELFKNQVPDQRVRALVDSITTRIPTEAIMFDVSVDRAVRRSTERLAEVMYTVLLRELGYAEDYDVAELEIELEAEGRLAELEERSLEVTGRDWRIARKGAQKISYASAILHAMNPRVYPAADSWARSIGAKSADITVGKLVDRAFTLTARRRPGKALAFIVDEVGQYVARSADKIEDLRAVVEQFGKESKNRLKARQAVAPVWIVVTSQEKLDEVVAAIDSRRVELAKLQDRFKYHVDLAPADIREVATRRVLAKRDGAVPALRELYRRHQGQLNAACGLERTTRPSEIREDDFVEFYPYLPHFIELSIDIVSGIRLQPGAPKHLGGSNRTIIKQAHEMLVNPRTNLADKTVGALVTLDQIYELVEGNLSSEKQKDISDITQRFKNDSLDQGWAARVAKVVGLLEFVRDLPRTPANIAAMLVDEVGRPAPVPEVRAALDRLVEAQFVRDTDDGFKLQTAQEKNWETERRSHLAPKPKDRNDIKREALGDIFSDHRLKTYRFEDLRTFTVGIAVDGVSVGESGSIPVALLVADDDAELPRKLAQARDDSRQPAHQNQLFWTLALTPEIDDLIANLYASRQMVTKYDQLRAQNRITTEEASSLASEKNEVLRWQSRLREKIWAALQAGTGVFRGVTRDGSALGKTFPETFKAFLDQAVPDLYPKIRLGARPLKGNEAEEVLKAANLNALPQVFYGGDQGLNLVVKDGPRFVPNTGADIAKEILAFLIREQSYGNKVTGKVIEDRFEGIGYGWERDLLRLVLAVLLRAGAVEVTSQGRRFRGHLDPQCRVPFVNNVAFRAASFAPRQAIGLKTLTSAVEHYEALSGDEVDVEEAALATAFKKLADDELKLLLPLEATARANDLPGLKEIDDYKTSLQTIQGADPDDCVRILADEGTSFKDSRARMRQLREALDGTGLDVIRAARQALRQMWPALKADDGGLADGGDAHLGDAASELASALQDDTFFQQLARIRQHATLIASAYRHRYRQAHEERARVFDAAIDEVKGQPEWVGLPDDVRVAVLTLLRPRVCGPLVLPDDAVVCIACQATLKQMASDLVALDGLKARAIARLQELAAPEVRIERVRLNDFFAAALDSDAAVDDALRRLGEHLHKLVAEGARIVLE